MSETDDTHRLAHPSLAAGDATGWFETLYAEQAAGTAEVPWDRETPNAMLVAWAEGHRGGGRAMVVGCGYGRDAEFVASLGYDTAAFDVSPTAIADARKRHPSSPVDYAVADLLALPAEWHGAFDFVLESHNVQSLPVELHAAASAAVGSLVAPGGRLLVFAAADGCWGEEETGPPWPLTRAELDDFAVGGVVLDHVIQTEGRWRAEYRRPT